MCHKFVINMYCVIALLFVFLHGTLIEKHKNVLIFFSYIHWTFQCEFLLMG